MGKKVAIVVRDRQAEAIRMAVGLTLADDEPTVYIMDRKLEEDDNIALNIETLTDFDLKIYTNTSENSKFELKSNEEIAKDLSASDVVIPY